MEWYIWLNVWIGNGTKSENEVYATGRERARERKGEILLMQMKGETLTPIHLLSINGFFEAFINFSPHLTYKRITFEVDASQTSEVICCGWERRITFDLIEI